MTQKLESQSQTQVETLAQPEIQVPRDKKGGIRWTILKDNPELLCLFVRSEAAQFYQQYGKISHQILFERGRSDLDRGITKYYPGSWKQLRHDLDLETSFTPPGSWSVSRIEQEGASFYENTGALTRKDLTTQRRGLLSAISRLYPGGLTGLQVNLGLKPHHKPKGHYTPDQIEKEAKEFVQEHGRLSFRLFDKHGKSSLGAYISKNYPGGMTALRAKIGSPVNYSPPGSWTEDRIRTEASDFFRQNGRITHNDLVNARRSALGSAIQKYYPGGWRKLKQDIGAKVIKKPEGYWTTDQIEQEALNFFRQQGKLTHRVLQLERQFGLSFAILAKYSGGIIALREKLDLGNDTKPPGYWTVERVQKEAQDFYNQTGRLTTGLLQEHGRQDLIAAISSYPGKLTQLKTDLGIELERRADWSPDIIEQEAQQFYQEKGTLSNNTLRDSGRGDLAHAIYRNYPGGIKSLTEKLGIKSNQRPMGYWTVGKIEEEALKHFQETGKLSDRDLKINKPYLAGAIYNRYPGGITALKRKLGINLAGKTEEVLPEEATADLDKLLE